VARIDLQRGPSPGFCAESERVVLEYTYAAGLSAQFGAQGTNGVSCTPSAQEIGECKLC